MKTVAIIGKGAREHALCWKLCDSALVTAVYVIPGNGGTASIPKVENINIQLDVQAITDWCCDKKVDLVVVGPEQFLDEGLSDLLAAKNIKCFGPSKKASQIEASKSWSKSFMDDVGIPTAKAMAFNHYPTAVEYIDKFPKHQKIVIKASGLAQGKGVVICENADEAKICAKEMLVSASLGSAGETIIIEEFLEGDEASVLAFCDGTNFSLMPPAQDHKRLKNNDEGPNTGGMGAVCPYYLDTDDIDFIKKEVFARAMSGMQALGHPFKGVLYAGLMLTRDGIKVLEFNCRFGDPETQVLIPLLETDIFSIFEACCDENLKSLDIKWKDECAVGVVMASGGYPTSSSAETIIHGLPLNNADDVQVFHAATELRESSYVAKSGRILTAVATNKSMLVASAVAKKVCSSLHFDGCQYRDDISNKAIARSILKKGARTYKSAGVDISSGNELVQKLKTCVTRTHDKAVVTPLGSFAAAYDLGANGFKSPLLVTGCDGVGTKMKIAEECNNYSTIGQDLVAMSVNDILALGAQPLFFLDYVACGELNVNQTLQLIEGIVDGCKKAGCALIGGETAEMPGIFQKNEYELAGFVVGAVEKDKMLPDKSIKAGDKVIYLPSSGVHSNGYSLLRKIMADIGLSYHQKAAFSPENLTYGEEFLKPTRIYSDLILELHKNSKIKAFAHITGGGLPENIIRVLPKNLSISLDATQWHIPPIFGWIAAVGEVPEHEMLRTFNCGVGGVIVVSAERAEEIAAELHSSVIGGIRICPEGQPKFEISHFDIQLRKAMLPFIQSLVELKPLPPKRVAVLISGTGSNMEALIKETLNSSSAAQIVLVISDKASAGGLNIAKRYNIPTQTEIENIFGDFPKPLFLWFPLASLSVLPCILIDSKETLYSVIETTLFILCERDQVVQKESNETREIHEQRIHSLLNAAKIDIVCLAGYMRILTESFVNIWRGKLLNIHPSLLPSFPGLRPQKQALDKGVRFSGCTVHFVEVEVDAGAIIEQGVVSIQPGDREEDLIERIKLVEHQIYPQALKLVASEKVKLDLRTGKLISA